MSVPNDNTKKERYVPPHLRNKSADSSTLSRLAGGLSGMHIDQESLKLPVSGVSNLNREHQQPSFAQPVQPTTILSRHKSRSQHNRNSASLSVAANREEMELNDTMYRSRRDSHTSEESIISTQSASVLGWRVSRDISSRRLSLSGLDVTSTTSSLESPQLGGKTSPPQQNTSRSAMLVVTSNWRQEAAPLPAEPDDLVQLDTDWVGVVCSMLDADEMNAKFPQASVLKHPDFIMKGNGDAELRDSCANKVIPKKSAFAHPCVVIEKGEKNGLVLCAQITAFSDCKSLGEKFPQHVEELAVHRRRWLVMIQADGPETHDGMPELHFREGCLDRGSWVNTENLFWMKPESLKLYKSKKGLACLGKESVAVVMKHHDDQYPGNQFGREAFLQATS
jgi:hypothetical protein